MKYSGPYRYILLLTGPKDKRVFSATEVDRKIGGFQSPVTAKSQPKIYVLKSEGEIIYIGYAGQAIGTRLGQGMRANGLNGYHGYKWKQLEEVELLVFVFEKKFSNKKDEKEDYKSYVEAIEAELVYLIREKTGQWPAFQNEIHFNNNCRDKVKKTAEEMYRLISN